MHWWPLEWHLSYHFQNVRLSFLTLPASVCPVHNQKTFILWCKLIFTIEVPDFFSRSTLCEMFLKSWCSVSRQWNVEMIFRLDFSFNQILFWSQETICPFYTSKQLLCLYFQNVKCILEILSCLCEGLEIWHFINEWLWTGNLIRSLRCKGFKRCSFITGIIFGFWEVSVFGFYHALLFLPSSTDKRK